MNEAKNNQVDSKEKLTPFVKWAGGKRQLLDYLIALSPKEYNNYYEPFVGAGALLFALTPDNAMIGDLNKELINVYKSVKYEKYFNDLLEVLSKHEEDHSDKHFYEIRDLDREENFQSKSVTERAARAIYLNKTCFNGLYRVNSSGYFNVPSARKKDVKTYDKTNMESLHKYLHEKNVKIRCADFTVILRNAKEGDFVYLDPPYDQEDGSSFVSYTKYNFNRKDQRRLYKTFVRLSNKNIKVMMSNSDTKFIRDLYKEYNIRHVYAYRLINSKSKGRGKIKEVIITNY